MPDEPAQMSTFATVSQPTFPIPADAVTMITNGGVAIATIVAVGYLLDRLARLAEVLRSSDDE